MYSAFSFNLKKETQVAPYLWQIKNGSTLWSALSLTEMVARVDIYPGDYIHFISTTVESFNLISSFKRVYTRVSYFMDWILKTSNI
jgi:hypothetical protein